MQTQLQLSMYIHVCLNETHSLARFNPYFGWIVQLLIIPAKVGIKSCRFAYFYSVFHLSIHGCIYSAEVLLA